MVATSWIILRVDRRGLGRAVWAWREGKSRGTMDATRATKFTTRRKAENMARKLNRNDGRAAFHAVFELSDRDWNVRRRKPNPDGRIQARLPLRDPETAPERLVTTVGDRYVSGVARTFRVVEDLGVHDQHWKPPRHFLHVEPADGPDPIPGPGRLLLYRIQGEESWTLWPWRERAQRNDPDWRDLDY